ncbi:MAG: ABC transporter permease [Chthonomonas sp.]|nr:ABC transporter permease [Chthonomonas sp.]
MKFLRENGALVALILLVVINGILNPGIFLQPENLRNILNQNVAPGILALGMTWVIITGGIDLSVGSALAFIGVVAVDTMNRFGPAGGTGVLIAIAVSVLLGLVAGWINGVVSVFGRVTPFVVTLVGLLAYRSAAQAYAQGGEVGAQNPLFQNLGTGGIPIPFIRSNDQPLVIYWSILVFFALAILFAVLLRKTAFGRKVVAIGSNERAAHYSGVAVNRTRIGVYALMGFCTGLAALLLASRMNGIATSTVGLYYELDAIAAVVVGGTVLRGGRGTIGGTVIGVLLLGVIQNVLVILGVNNYLQGIVKGGIILAAVLLQRGQSD